MSRAVADTFQKTLVRELGAEVVQHDLALDPLPADAWTHTAATRGLPTDQRTPEQQAAYDLVSGLADELIAADALVIAVPLYNFGVSQHLKTWFDLIIADPRFAPGQQPIAGRPATLVVARGGGYGEDTPRAGWDHATPYYERILSDVWGLDLTVIEAELTLAHVTPAMAELRGLADEKQSRAHDDARSRAREIGESLRRAA